MGWFTPYEEFSSKKEFAEYILNTFSHDRTQDQRIIVIDHALHKDGLTILYQLPNGLQDKHLYHFLISESGDSDGRWSYKSIHDCAGPLINHCPARLIKAFKTDNARWEKAQANKDYTFNTIERWQKARSKKRISFIPMIRKVLEKDPNANIEIYFNDGGTFRGESLDGRWFKLQPHHQTKQAMAASVDSCIMYFQSKHVRQIKINGELFAN